MRRLATIGAEMKLHGSMTINGRAYASGDDIPGTMVYPFFLMHMHVFGVSVGLYLLAHLLEG